MMRSRNRMMSRRTMLSSLQRKPKKPTVTGKEKSRRTELDRLGNHNPDPQGATKLPAKRPRVQTSFYVPPGLAAVHRIARAAAQARAAKRKTKKPKVAAAVATAETAAKVATKSAGKAAKSVGTPAKSVGKPAKSAGKPAKSAAKPAKSAVKVAKAKPKELFEVISSPAGATIVVFVGIGVLFAALRCHHSVLKARGEPLLAK